MMELFQDRPGLIYVVATLLPLLSFVVLLVAGGVRNFLRFGRGPAGLPGRIGAHVATAAIALAFVCSLIGFIGYHTEHEHLQEETRELKHKLGELVEKKKHAPQGIQQAELVKEIIGVEWEIGKKEARWSDSVMIPPCASGAVNLQVVVAASVSNALAYDAVGPVVATASATFRPAFVGMASTPSGNGYWEVASDGGVFTLGRAGFYGSMGGKSLHAPIVGMVATTDGGGYWLVGADGGVFAFGDAGYFGSAGNLRLVAPIVGMAATADGGGYWLVASDGGVFSYGDARFQGSMGGKHLFQPVVGMAADRATGGYWLVATDGGIFSFGAPFDGSTGNLHLTRPVVGMEAAPDGSGYRLVATDGGLFSFHLPFEGSAATVPLAQPVVAMAAQGATGYWMVARDGGIFTFGTAAFLGSQA